MNEFVRVEMRGGEHREIAATPGHSIMEILRDGGVDEILALCGGCCSCATCHIIVAPDWFAKLEPMSEDEDDLLDTSSSREAYSRLSCQILFDAALSGIEVRIAPEE
jgi:2Fe-2S ferredoxin